MGSYRASKVLRVSSTPNVAMDVTTAGNTAAAFRVKLSTPLHLPVGGGNVVALSTCTLPNRFESLPLAPYERRFSVIKNFQKVSVGYIPRNLTTVDEIIRAFNSVISEHNIACASTTDGRLTFFFPVEGQFTINMHKHVAYFAGYGVDYVSTSEALNRDALVRFAPNIPPSGTGSLHSYQMMLPPRLELYIPKNIFLYADFVDTTTVGGEDAQLLKIMHVNKTADPYIITEFENLEYFPLLANNALTDMYLEMRDHRGKRICFADDKLPCIMSFIFKSG